MRRLGRSPTEVIVPTTGPFSRVHEPADPVLEEESRAGARDSSSRTARDKNPGPMLHTALATAAALVALAFACSTFERWQGRRRPHELAWSAALGLFALAAGTLAAGEAVGWNEPLFRLYFLLGAVVNVPVLALGTVLLLGGSRRWALA